MTTRINGSTFVLYLMRGTRAGTKTKRDEQVLDSLLTMRSEFEVLEAADEELAAVAPEDVAPEFDMIILSNVQTWLGLTW